MQFLDNMTKHGECTHTLACNVDLSCVRYCC